MIKRLEGIQKIISKNAEKGGQPGVHIPVLSVFFLLGNSYFEFLSVAKRILNTLVILIGASGSIVCGSVAASARLRHICCRAKGQRQCYFFVLTVIRALYGDIYSLACRIISQCLF